MAHSQDEGRKHKLPQLQFENSSDCFAAATECPTLSHANIIASEIKPTKMKPPCKKKFQENFEDIWSKIKGLEAQLKSLHVSSSAASITKDEQIKSLKLDRSIISSRRKEIAEQLENPNKQSVAKKTNLMKLQHDFQYKSEDLINNAISKLDYQLKTNNYRASEERKIVQEIDSLNRSKKSLSEYNMLKGEVNDIRLQQASLRKEKDNIFAQLQSIKAQEDGMKAQDMANKQKIVEIKQNLDDLHQQKRHLIGNHQQEIHIFELLKEQKHKEAIKKKEEEQRAAHSAKKKEIAESISIRKPYQEESLLCETLISYLQRYESTPSSTPSSSVNTPIGSIHTPVSPVVKELETGEMVYVLKKKENDDFSIQSGRKGKKCRNKDKKRTLQNKILHHTPQVFEQFCRLNLQAPSIGKEIPVSIEQLKTKKKYYLHLNANPEAACGEHVLCSLSSSSSEKPFDTADALYENSNSSPNHIGCEQKIDEREKRTTESETCDDVSCTQKNSELENTNSNSKEKSQTDIIDDGYSEVSLLDQIKDSDDYKSKVNVTKCESNLIPVAPSDTWCSNSSADSALAEEVKSLESPDVIYSVDNRFSNWQNV